MKNLTFQGIFELQIDLEEKVLASHTCLRYSKGPPGSHNSSAHRIMCIRGVERNIFQFGASPPQKGPFLGGTGPMVRAAPRRCVYVSTYYSQQTLVELFDILLGFETDSSFYLLFGLIEE